ncbi:MAG: hypothetical protein H0W12_11730 [Chitinophagaceae bacterium]|nr:hypothetical protein [Chitinophagaceae bacterium]
MKKIFLLFLIIGINVNHCCAQNKNYHYTALVAQKNNRLHNFLVRERVAVISVQDNSSKYYRGIITGFSDDGIYLSSFKRHDTSLQYIPVNTIVSVNNLLRTTRLTTGIMGLVAGGLTILLSSSNNHGAADNYSGLFSIFTATGAILISATFISTFITERMKTKSTKNNWHFSLQ